MADIYCSFITGNAVKLFVNLCFCNRIKCSRGFIEYDTEFFAGIDSKKDDYLDFAEDFEPIRKFFSGDQKGIFDKSLHLMKIYDDSKTFIVDAGVESVVESIKAILRKPAPYSEIFKLPDLNMEFIERYSKLLTKMQEPVEAAIDEARTRVFEVLKGKRCHDKLKDKYVQLFRELHEKATHCNNVATLQNIKVEADALKVRCLNEIEHEEAKLTPVEPVEVTPPTPSNGNDNTPPAVTPAPTPTPIKRRKTVSIKSINNASSWQIETPEDVRRYVAELEKKLVDALEDNTVINIEF